MTCPLCLTILVNLYVSKRSIDCALLPNGEGRDRLLSAVVGNGAADKRCCAFAVFVDVGFESLVRGVHLP